MDRILIFSLSYYPRFVGGAEVAVKEITDRIDSVRFDMITLGDGRGQAVETIGNVTVYRIFGRFGTLQKLLYPFLAARKARQLHSLTDYKAVWSIMASYAGYAGYIFKKRNPLVSFILTVQEGDNFGRRAGLLKPLFRRIFAAADRIQVISSFLAEWSKEMGAKSPVGVVPNGVDFDKFSRPIPSEERNRIRREHGFKDTDTVLVTTSRLVHKNAVDSIIMSLAYLDATCKLLVLGSGPLETNLRSLACNLGVTERVIFKGYVTHDDLPRYLQASEIFVRPSRSEGLGNSFLEAMAAGIPVIATPVGGIIDFLAESETGLFCDVDKPESIAKKVNKLMRDKESRDYMVSKACALVKEKYNWNIIARNMEDILMP